MEMFINLTRRFPAIFLCSLFRFVLLIHACFLDSLFVLHHVSRLALYDPSSPLANSCHSRANQRQNIIIMKSLVSFMRSSQARAFARQYSGFKTSAAFSSMISS